MKKNAFITNVFTETGMALAKAFRADGYYTYGVDKKEDYEGLCDRALRFDLYLFVTDASYRVRFTQVFDEIMPHLDTLIFCSGSYQPARMEDLQLDYWNATLFTEVTGPLMLSKLFNSRLKATDGSILFLSGQPYLEQAHVDLAYQTSRSAIKGLMEAICLDMEGKVKANAINTSFVDKENDQDNETYLKEVADMALYLASRNKGAVNGTVVDMLRVGENKRRL